MLRVVDDKPDPAASDLNEEEVKATPLPENSRSNLRQNQRIS